jgi:hypothetical protein
VSLVSIKGGILRSTLRLIVKVLNVRSSLCKLYNKCTMFRLSYICSSCYSCQCLLLTIICAPSHFSDAGGFLCFLCVTPAAPAP